MKNAIFTFCVFIVVNTSAQTWVQKASMPVSRKHTFSFTINGKIYVGGGYNNGTFYNTFYEYNPASDTWQAKAPIPEANYGAASFAINGFGYSVCGFNYVNGQQTVSKKVFRYNPVTDTWQQMNDFPGTARAPSGGFGEGVVINGFGYMACGFWGGLGNSPTIEELWRYNPVQDLWARMTDVPNAPNAPSTGRSAPVALSVGNYMYIGMGGNATASVVYTDFYRYDPAADNGYGTGSTPYTQLAPIPVGRMSAAHFVIGNILYCGLGETGVLNDFWTYNFTTNAWGQINNFGGVARSHPFVQVVNGLPYVGTGNGGNFVQSPALSDVWTWGDSCNITANIGNDTTLCVGNTITLSDTNTNASFLWNTNDTTSSITVSTSGTYWVELTKNGCVVRDTVEITFSSSSQNWVQKAPLPSAHTGHAPVHFSLNGKLYVGGGWNANSPWGVTTDSMFEYTPAIDSWRVVARLPTKLYESSCFELNGKGYIVCGANPNYTNAVYEYDPAAGALGTWTPKGTFPGFMRMNGIGFSYNGKGYVFGGFFNGVTNEMWEYDPVANSWTQLNSCPGPGRNRPIYLIINNQIFVGMGCDNGGNVYYNDFYRFDPNAVNGSMRGTYTALNPAPISRDAAAIFTIGGYGYVGLGSTLVGGTPALANDFWKYDPTNDTWTQLNNFNGGARTHVFSEVVGNLPYVGCGSDVRTGGAIVAHQQTDIWTWGVCNFCNLTANIGNDTTLCAGNTITLSDTNTNASFLWNTGDTTSSITVSASSTYWVEVTKDSCTARDTVQVTFIFSPLDSATVDTSFCTGESIQIGAISSSANSYEWNTNDTTPTIFVSGAGTYTQTVSNACGQTTNTFNVSEKLCDCTVLFPTAFTPNGDGKNDDFGAIYHCPLTQYQLRIYNRWGELVFSTNNINERWDGKFKNTPQPIGTFVYYTQYTDPFTNKVISKQGNVTLVR